MGRKEPCGPSLPAPPCAGDLFLQPFRMCPHLCVGVPLSILLEILSSPVLWCLHESLLNGPWDRGRLGKTARIFPCSTPRSRDLATGGHHERDRVGQKATRIRIAYSQRKAHLGLSIQTR